MNTKYKINELAKDLNVQNNDIIELLGKQFEGAKKATTALSVEELNFVLEHYSQNNQVKNFDEYFKATAKKPEPKKETVAEKAPVPKPQEEQKKENVPQKKAVENQQNPRQQQQNKPQHSQPQQPRQQSQQHNRPDQFANKNRPQNPPQHKNAPAQSQNDKFSNPFNKNQQPHKPKQQPAEQKPSNKMHLATNAPKDNNAPRGEVVTRTVDTRGSYVELDKYNEKYTNLAQGTTRGKDNYVKKQKLNKKSTQRNKQQYRITSYNVCYTKLLRIFGQLIIPLIGSGQQ